MLSVRELHGGYGKIQVLHSVSFEVREGELVCLLGSNGAGKTTTLRCIAGLMKPSQGLVEFDGRDVTGWPPWRLVEAGLVLVPEGRRLFLNMTVLENLELGAYSGRVRNRRLELMEAVFELFPDLKERLHQPVGTMSGGQQQMVAIGRALMASPKLLILDEPSIGLSPLMTQQVLDAVKRVREDGVTVLLVEQHVHNALLLADRGYVLENGRIVLQGAGRELLNDDSLRKAYLGM